MFPKGYQANLLSEKESKTTVVAAVKGVGVAAQDLFFENNKLSISAALENVFDESIANATKWSEPNTVGNSKPAVVYDELFAVLVRGQQVTYMPLRMAQHSEMGYLRLENFDLLETVKANSVDDFKESLTVGKSPTIAEVVLYELVQTKGADAAIDELLEYGRKARGISGIENFKFNYLDSELVTKLTEIDSAITSLETEATNDQERAEAQAAIDLLRTQAKQQLITRTANNALWKSIQQDISGNAKYLNEGQLTLRINNQTIGDVPFTDKYTHFYGILGNLNSIVVNSGQGDLLPIIAVLSRPATVQNSTVTKNIVIPIVNSATGMTGYSSKYGIDLQSLRLFPGDTISFYSSMDKIPAVIQGKYVPRIEKVLREREEKIKESQRLVNRFRLLGQKNYPLSSNLPSQFRGLVRPIEKVATNLGNAVQKTIGNITPSYLR